MEKKQMKDDLFGETTNLSSEKMIVEKQIKQNQKIYNIFYRHLEKYALVAGLLISVFYVVILNFFINYTRQIGLLFIMFNTAVFLLLGFWAKSLIHYTNVDHVTNLYNRKFLSIELNSWLNDINKTKPLTMLVLDIDNFKEINDTKGHLIGDEVIQRVSRILKNKFRKDDIVARWGGDEFVVVTPNINEEKGYQLAKEVAKEVKDFACHRVQVTVSIGIVTTYKNIPLDDFFDKGDNALYEAKIKRNSVVRHKTIIRGG